MHTHHNWDVLRHNELSPVTFDSLNRSHSSSECSTSRRYLSRFRKVFQTTKVEKKCVTRSMKISISTGERSSSTSLPLALSQSYDICDVSSALICTKQSELPAIRIRVIDKRSIIRYPLYQSELVTILHNP